MNIQGPQNEANVSVPAVSVARRPAVAVAAEVKAVPATNRPAPPRIAVPDMREIQQKIAVRLQEFLRSSGRNLEFRVDDAAGATVITVRRADTGEVVRQYPTEEALALLRRLHAQAGTFLEATA
jgi:flagellar protein FlaG